MKFWKLRCFFTFDNFYYDKNIEIKAQYQRLTFGTFWNLLDEKWSPENYSNLNGLKSPFRQREAKQKYFKRKN